MEMWADVHHTQNNSQTWWDESLPRRMVWRSLWTKRYGVSRGVWGGLANQNLLFMGDGQAYYS